MGFSWEAQIKTWRALIQWLYKSVLYRPLKLVPLWQSINSKSYFVWAKVWEWHIYILRACHKKTQRERRRKGQRRARTMDTCNVVDDSVSVAGHVELLKMHLPLLLGSLCQLAMAMAVGIFGVCLDRDHLQWLAEVLEMLSEIRGMSCLLKHQHSHLISHAQQTNYHSLAKFPFRFLLFVLCSALRSFARLFLLHCYVLSNTTVTPYHSQLLFTTSPPYVKEVVAFWWWEGNITISSRVRKTKNRVKCILLSWHGTLTKGEILPKLLDTECREM